MSHKFFSKIPRKVIIKFNFNSLFSQAWLQSLVPANLIPGFKTCGIYPLNQDAVKPVSTTSEKYSANQQGTNEGNKAAERYTANEEHSTTMNLEKKVTAPEQEDLFRKRFDEGYDLCIDPDYNAQLKLNHPESLMDSSGSVVAEYTT